VGDAPLYTPVKCHYSYRVVSIKILCDAAPPIFVVLIAADDVAPLSFCPSQNCPHNDPELRVAADTAWRVAHFDAGVLGCIHAVVVVQKSSHSDSGHRSCFVETHAILVTHTKLEVMQCVVGLVRRQVVDDLAVVAELERDT
jgi:hypothetical protein